MGFADFMKVDVLFAITGDARLNSRALKQLALLSDEGYSVQAIGLGDSAGESQIFDRVTYRALTAPEGSGPLFFGRLHRLFSKHVAEYTARIYHASDLYVLPAQGKRAQLTSGKLVYDARERYPYVASTTNRPWVSWFWEMVERSHIRHVDAVFTVSKSIASHLAASYGISYPAVLYNAPPLQDVPRSDLLRRQLDLPAETAIVLHQGKIQNGRGCQLLMHAMQFVERAVLVFLGDGPLRKALATEAKRLQLSDKVFFLDPVPPMNLLETTASADIGVSLLEDTCLNHRYALPNKLFEYLMAGVPVLASDLPEMENVVAPHDVGCVVKPSNAREIAGVLQSMVDRPEARATWSQNTRSVFETFSWEKASETFRGIYRNLSRVEVT